MRQRFPGKNFAVRNLGYSGDSPLGASRASFDPVAKGVDSLREQLAVVKPTVAVLGYGMAASLDDLTYRRNDPVLNPDPARYGVDHSPAKFRRELTELMELIVKASPQGQVRFVFVGPIRHEDLRATRPGLPDPAEHNALLAQYEQVLRELAAERKAPFVRGDWKDAGVELAQGTDNGIHLNEKGYRALAASFARQLGWRDDVAGWDAETKAQGELRAEILRKNSLFFHRSRPANYTYIFGFRRGEQGRNAVEIPKFDPLVDKAEANVIGLSAGRPSTLPPEPKSEPKLAALPPLTKPEFKLEPGLDISLFAENPFLEKPVHMSWDGLGRLWVATSNTYPQVNPDDLGAQMEGNSAKFGPSTGNDKIILLEDTNKDGVAETSRIVGLMSHSRMLRSSMRSWPVPRTSNWRISPRAVLNVPSFGSPWPTAIRPFASGRRSATSWRASMMSVPSRKTIVTSEIPNREMLRISSTFGNPLIDNSTG